MDIQNIGSSNAKFGINLYQKLAAATPDENLFFSPISLLFALAITLLGAKEKTEAEIKSVLKLEQFSNVHIQQGIADMMKHLQTANGDYTLNIANKLYGEQSAEFLSTFIEESKQYYGAGLEAVDFIRSADEITSKINDWVEAKTQQKIKNLIPSGTLDALTKLVIVNAIYFKGTWKTQFDENETELGSFVTPYASISNVHFMHIPKFEAKYFYYEHLKSQVLELPYKGESLSLVIILPLLEVTSLESVEKKLNGDVFSTIERNLYKKLVEIWLPKFRIEKKSDVLEHLKSLGLNDLFSGNKADLSRMNGKKNLYVSDLLHKAFIEVNEEGSEAAAATGKVISIRSGYKNLVYFKADHPFIFYIKDNKSASILFLGRLSHL